MAESQTQQQQQQDDLAGMPPNLVYRPPQLAAMLGVTTQTLANWRHDHIGPRFVRMGGSHAGVVYRVSDVERYLADNVVETDTRGRRRRSR